MKYHGVAYGMYTADNHLNGSNPTQGTTLAAVSEMLTTLETLAGMGEMSRELPDILEKIAFNALAGAFSADMRRVQRLEQANQVLISEEERAFYNAETDATLYGDLFSFDAVRALSAWPRLAAHLWYATSDGGLWPMSYAPCCVRARLGDVPVRLRVSGGYPFAETVRLEVAVKRPVEFPLYLRIPAWVRQPMIYLPDGEIMQVRAGETACVRRRWQTGDEVRLELSVAPHVSRGWYHQSAAVELGPASDGAGPGNARGRKRARGYARGMGLGVGAGRAHEGRPHRRRSGRFQGWRAAGARAGQGGACGLESGRWQQRPGADSAAPDRKGNLYH